MQIYKTVLLTSIIILNLFAKVNAHVPKQVINGETSSLSEMLKKVSPSVVSIFGLKRVKAQPNPSTEQTFAPQMQPSDEQISVTVGSGVIVDAQKGYIITNEHVINELDDIRVSLIDQRKFDAKLIGKDSASDLALIQINPDKLQSIELADSDTLEVGDFVVAIGNPFNFSHTVTSGIISALSRSKMGLDGYFDFIQTDAAINFGNSGGGLITMQGKLAGINTAMISPSGAHVGLGLAIPANMVKSILSQLAAHGHVDRGPLGVRVQDLTPDLAKAFEVKDFEKGAVINDVIANTPAQQAGLQIGDVILQVNNKEIKDCSYLRTTISLIPVGKTVEITYSRNGKIKKTNAKILSPKDRFIAGESIYSGLAGASLEENFDEQQNHGVRISELEKGSFSKQSDLHQGDIIIGANQLEIKSCNDLKQAAKRNKQMLLLQVVREKTPIFIAVKPKN